MVPGDHDRAGTGLLALLDEVDVLQALAAVGSLELLGELVVANTAREDDRVRRKAVLNQPVRRRDREERWQDLPPHRAPRSATRRQRRT
jgi:hypothetical protein